jgi:hypothetical protein
MIFSYKDKILFDGTINSYNGEDYSASVDIYRNGAIDKTKVPATATVKNKISAVITLNGTDLGKAVLTIDNEQALYERDATDARFKTISSYGWADLVAIKDGRPYISITSLPNEPTFSQGQLGSSGCKYINVSRTSPNEMVNVYKVGFDSAILDNTICNHLGEKFQGLATIIDGGSRLPDGTNGLMWFITANGKFSSFAELTYAK